jgi:hypothetical protein
MRQSPNILPALGKLPVVKLTTQRLHDWHRGLAERARYWRSRKSAAANLAAFDPKDTEDVSRRRASANRVLTYLATGQAVPGGGGFPRPLSQPRRNGATAQRRRRRLSRSRLPGADRFALNTLPIIREAQKAGASSLRAIAKVLNDRGVCTARGGIWVAPQVRDILRRTSSTVRSENRHP